MVQRGCSEPRSGRRRGRSAPTFDPAPPSVNRRGLVARADPANGALALELFRSNRFAGLLLFAGFAVIGLSSAA